jgi:hypothetical protein
MRNEKSGERNNLSNLKVYERLIIKWSLKKRCDQVAHDASRVWWWADAFTGAYISIRVGRTFINLLISMGPMGPTCIQICKPERIGLRGVAKEWCWETTLIGIYRLHLKSVPHISANDLFLANT